MTKASDLKEKVKVRVKELQEAQRGKTPLQLAQETILKLKEEVEKLKEENASLSEEVSSLDEESKEEKKNDLSSGEKEGRVP